jgi:hypothetical protein
VEIFHPECQLLRKVTDSRDSPWNHHGFIAAAFDAIAGISGASLGIASGVNAEIISHF